MKTKRLAELLLILTLLVGLAACQQTDAASQTAGASAGAAAAPITTPSGLVSAEGEIVPLQKARLSFTTGGVVAEVLVTEGDVVQAGDPLLRLDASPVEAALRQAEAGLAAAEANLAAAQAEVALAESAVTRAEVGVVAAEAELALTQAGPRPEEIAAAENNVAAAEGSIIQAAGNRDAAVSVSDARVRAAEAQVAAALADYQTVQDAYDQILNACFTAPDGSEVCPLYGPVEENVRAQLAAAQLRLNAAQAGLEQARAGATPAQRQAAEAGVILAINQRNLAQAQLALAQAGARQEQIRQAEVGVEQARLAVEQAGVRVAQAEAAVTQAEANVAGAQARVAEARAALARATLTAPFTGTVSAITVEVGELVAPAVPVVRFADLSGWLVETTDLTELDVVNISEGQTVEIQVDAIPGEILQGTVREIAAVSQLTRGDVTYKVTLDLEDYPNLPLRWGMTVFVNIQAK